MAKQLGSLLFGANYLGVIFGALTTPTTDSKDERRTLFLWTVAKHALFMGNCYLIYLMKFPLAQHNALNLANDAAAFACCFPNYMIVAWPKISTYLSGSTKERGLPASQAEALLEKASVEEILDSLNQSEKDHSRQEE